MSHVRCTTLAQKPDCMAAVRNLLTLKPRLFCMAIDSMQRFVDSAAQQIARSIPCISLECVVPCEIPETECPPYCVCEFCWEVCPGERVRRTIRVTNTGCVARDMCFQATPFVDACGKAIRAPSVTPASAHLAPGESVVLQVTLDVENDFVPGNDYEARVLIRSAYEQCVCLHLRARPVAECCCHVKHGEPPKRIRAHRWYDHFQCTEPCHPVPCEGKDEGRPADKYQQATEQRREG